LITPLENGPEFSHASPRTARGTLRIAETFSSRQGEGLLTGTESFFIRTSGCNLRCWFCDTPYASWEPQGKPLGIDELVQQTLQSGLRHVVVTGGEPLLPLTITSLCGGLRQAGLHVTIETAGTVDRQVACDLMSISPKLASSSPDAAQHAHWHDLHHRRRLPLEIMRRLIDQSPQFQLKFVVESAADYPELTSIVDQLRVAPGDVWLMPQGCTTSQLDAAAQWLKPWCEQHGFRYCDRMQIRWFGNRRGT
jgi:7-carboxy-7-deazaguanine synthase